LSGSFGGLHRPSCQRGDGLRWNLIDFERLVMEVREGYARSEVTKLKSECSLDELPWIQTSQPFCWNGGVSDQRRPETGFFRAHGRTNLTILARSGRRCSRLLRRVPRFKAPLGGTRCGTATELGSTRLVRLSAYNGDSCATRISRPR
jgi:hypothetical protein